MPEIPALKYGTVSWTAVLAVADGEDVDSIPDIIPISNGVVTFTPSSRTFLVTEGLEPVTVIGQPVPCEMQNGKLVDAEGRHTVTLLADSPTMTPVDWTWRVDYVLNDGRVRGGFSFHLDPDEHVDLTTVTPIPASNGEFLTKGDKGDPGEPGIGLPASELDGLVADLVAQTGSEIDSELRLRYPTISTLNAGLAGKQDVLTLDSAVATAMGQPASAITAKVKADFEAKISRTGATTGQVATLASDGTIVWTTATVGPATTTSQGVVRLAGDLAGTADAPTVPGLAQKANDADLATVAKTGSYTDLTNRPGFAAVATSGLYSDLAGKPVIPVAYTDAMVRSVLAATLIEGPNVDINVNQTTGTIQISATGGGGTGGTPSNILVLGSDDPVPPGTAAGTLIVRTGNPTEEPDPDPVALAVMGTSTTNSSTSVVTLDKPAGVEDGELLVVVLSSQTAATTPVDWQTPTGWVLMANPAASGGRQVAAYALPVPSAAALTETSFIFSGAPNTPNGNRVQGAMFRVAGADLTTPQAGATLYFADWRMQSWTTQATGSLVIAASMTHVSSGAGVQMPTTLDTGTIIADFTTSELTTVSRSSLAVGVIEVPDTTVPYSVFTRTNPGASNHSFAFAIRKKV